MVETTVLTFVTKFPPGTRCMYMVCERRGDKTNLSMLSDIFKNMPLETVEAS